MTYRHVTTVITRSNHLTCQYPIQECEDRPANDEQNQSESGNYTTRNHGVIIHYRPVVSVRRLAALRGAARGRSGAG
jgi:hypothetical protein